MVCQVCGRSVEAGDRFCTGCGVSLAERPPVDEAAASVPGAPEATTTTADDLDIGSLNKVVAAAAREGELPGERAAASAVETVETVDAVAEPVADDATIPTPIAESQPTSEPAATPAGESSGDSSVDPSVDPAAATELVELVDDDGWGDADPVWAPTAPNPKLRTAAAATRTTDLPETEPITEVWGREAAEGAAVTRATTELGFDATDAAGATAQMPTVAPVVEPPIRRIRFSAVTVFGIIAGIVALVAFFTTIVAIESDVRLEPVDDAPEGFRTGTWILDDLADNLSIAGLLAILAIVIGAIASMFRWRWGSGLAAGAGLSIAGLAMLAIGLAQEPIDAAEEFAGIPNEQLFTLTITRDVGYWLLVVAGAIGVVVFFAAINDATGDQRSGLNPWIAALGGLATVVAVGGPLIPENLADFTDNWYITEGPGNPSAMLLVGRLVQLGLVLLAGLVGFLSVRRWGLGVAIGGALPTLWLAISVLFDITDNPAGPGWRNPGAGDTHLHGVTIIGMSALLAMWILAAIAAYDQGIRERR